MTPLALAHHMSSLLVHVVRSSLMVAVAQMCVRGMQWLAQLVLGHPMGALTALEGISSWVLSILVHGVYVIAVAITVGLFGLVISALAYATVAHVWCSLMDNPLVGP